jgi:CRISPR-associated protein Cas5t
MTTFYVRVRAPFAAFRWLQAGSYRATSPVVPPSAAWGLVLNLAGIDTRGEDDGVSTLTIPEAPAFEVAVGAVGAPERVTLYQQLHGYPVGNSGKELADRSHGAKYWIAPVRRELLVGFDAVVGVRTADAGLRQRVVDGLGGSVNQHRYGLPFAGDNNFLVDRVDVLDNPPPALWYEQVGTVSKPRAGSCRLTVRIDRADSSRTLTALFAPTELAPSAPESAWTWVPSPPS